MEHKSVFKNEIIEHLDISPIGIYIDLTLGGGGHAKSILNKLTTGKLIVFDIDKKAIDNFQSEIGENEDRVILVNKNFERLEDMIKELGIPSVQGIIADLGWSSDQLSYIPGLSFGHDEKLDMRFDQNLQITAADLLNALYKNELLHMFAKNADIRGPLAIRLVNEIIKFRSHKLIATTGDLNAIISALSPATKHTRNPIKSGYADQLPARVFQALRIAVNNELSTLQSTLPQAWHILDAGGRLLVITFHSGEDRIVKDYFRKLVAKDNAVSILPNDFTQPTVAELKENIRARSAKLRGVMKKI